MKHLKLIINNQKEKLNKYFDKKELKIILNLYAKMVSNGEWKDYGLSISKHEISFNVYKRTAEFPVYRITKNLNLKNTDNRYLIKDRLGHTIQYSNNLENLIQKVKWNKFKLVN